MAAFGTTRAAMATYERLDAAFRERFPGHEIHWAYTSRMVTDRLRHGRGLHRPNPHEVIRNLADACHCWAVVQSLHLTCGHEFYRLVAEVRHPRLRFSMGLPLLCDPDDYHAVADAIVPLAAATDDEALIMVGHGTDHPTWSSYTALHHMLQQRFGPRVHVGSAERGYPDRESIVTTLCRAGYAKACLMPLMLVAGAHFEEDLAGEEDSWKSALEGAGIRTRLHGRGLGLHPPVIAQFARHVAAALDIIPESDREGAN
jgi:sirohydrochlorin cobaltochelatase